MPEPSLKDGFCPRCGGTDIYSGASVPEKDGDRGANRIPINATFHVPLDNYICEACGYVESFINDRAMLNRIAREWPRVEDDEA